MTEAPPNAAPEIAPGDAHNRRLVDLTHPRDWVNPKPQERYNLVVIGAGTAGLVSAAGAAALGARVALVERHLMGGDCLNYGCVPSKALIRSARAAAAVRDAEGFGIDVPAGAAADFARVMERLRRLRADIGQHDSVERFRSLGVDVFLGSARFVGRESVAVGDQLLRFSRAVIATGGRAAAPPIPGLAEAGYLTNETVFSLTALPKRLVVIGAGPIGCEMAQSFARLGSRVVLVTAGPQVLPREDPEAAAFVERALRADGVDVRCGVEVTAAGGAPGAGRRLDLERGGQAEQVEADEVLVAVGRVPNLRGLGLEAAGVVHGPQGVEVDDFLRTSNPHIFAAGDVCSAFKFTHAADAMARIVLRNALFFGRDRVSRLTVPWCTYTSPELAHVGLTEKDARGRGIAIETVSVPLHDVDRARLDGEDGLLKVVVRKGSDRILGATLVAANAGDIVGELTLAVAAGIGLKKLAATVHPYPTQAEVVKRAADAYNRTRLTPRVRAWLERLLAWRR